MVLPSYGQPIVRIQSVDFSNLSVPGEAAGDLIYYNGGAAQWDRLPVGANNDVLTVIAGVPTWSATLTNVTLAGTPTAAGAIWGDLGSVTTVDVNGGSVDGATIGAAVPSTIVGTTIDATTDFTIGATVITDGVLTDAGGFQMAAVLDMASNAINNIGAPGNDFGAAILNLAAGYQVLGANALAINTTAGDITIGAAAGADVLIGDDATVLTVGGGDVVTLTAGVRLLFGSITRGYIEDYFSSPNRGLRYTTPGDAGGWYGNHDFWAGFNGAAAVLVARISILGLNMNSYPLLNVGSGSNDWTATGITTLGSVAIGVAGTNQGSLTLAGLTSGVVTVAVNAVAGTWTMTLPAAVGAAGEQLTDVAGNGITSWQAAASRREYKDIITPVTEPRDALDRMLGTQVYKFHYKDGKGTGDTKTEYWGVMGDEAPWAMHHSGGIVNPVNALGHTVLAFQATHSRIDKVERNIAKLQSELVGLRG